MNPFFGLLRIEPKILDRDRIAHVLRRGDECAAAPVSFDGDLSGRNELLISADDVAACARHDTNAETRQHLTGHFKIGPHLCGARTDVEHADPVELRQCEQKRTGKANANRTREWIDAAFQRAGDGQCAVF